MKKTMEMNRTDFLVQDKINLLRAEIKKLQYPQKIKLFEELTEWAAPLFKDALKKKDDFWCQFDFTKDGIEDIKFDELGNKLPFLKIDLQFPPMRPHLFIRLESESFWERFYEFDYVDYYEVKNFLKDQFKKYYDLDGEPMPM